MRKVTFELCVIGGGERRHWLTLCGVSEHWQEHRFPTLASCGATCCEVRASKRSFPTTSTNTVSLNFLLVAPRRCSTTAATTSSCLAHTLSLWRRLKPCTSLTAISFSRWKRCQFGDRRRFPHQPRSTNSYALSPHFAYHSALNSRCLISYCQRTRRSV